MAKTKIALVGNPNCGKTTMFNSLTGTNQYVGNWPGVTVEKVEGIVKEKKDVVITDLPGVYSLSPYTPEEIVTRNYLVGEESKSILNIVDATNIERNLYLTTQLLEMGKSVVVALNMIDVLNKKGDKINVQKLQERLGCSIVETSALKAKGITEAVEKVVSENKVSNKKIFESDVEEAILKVESEIVSLVGEKSKRWWSIKLLEKDSVCLKTLSLSETQIEKINQLASEIEKKYDDDFESIITNQRYNYITKVLDGCVEKRSSEKLSMSDKIDRIVTNRILALPIFVGIMWFIYTISIGTIGDWTVGFMNDTLFGETIIPFVTNCLENIGCAPFIVSLIADGIIGGVGAVLGFVPQLLILFLLLCILEDVGYMARVAFIMDRIFRKFGLSGKSFIPMLIGTGCGVPGIMASRTIENERDRKITIITTGFIPCGAKMPIVGLIAAALFNNSAWVATAAYFIGVAAVVISGILLKKTKSLASTPSPFVMELPSYHLPAVKNVLLGTWERGWSFIKRAGTVIVLASILIWLLNSFSFEEGFHYITEENGGASILEIIGSFIAVIFKPLGFGNWQSAVATVLGLVAKEEVVGVFGSLSSMADADLAFELVEEGSAELALIGQEFFDGSKLRAFSFMIFNLLCAPCFAAMGAIKREMNDPKWTCFAISYMCVFAYLVSFITYQIGNIFVSGFSFVSALGIICLLGLIFALIMPKNNKI